MPERKKGGGKPRKKIPAAKAKRGNTGATGKKLKKPQTRGVNAAEKQIMGARNPYALAEAVMGERYDWAVMEEYDRKKVLERALRRPYKQLFDPVYGSPIFSRAQSARPRGVEGQTHSSTTPCSTLPDTPCAALAGGAYHVPPPTKPSVVDPVQGCSGDCFLVSAITSLAWVSPNLLPRKPGPTYTYTFWNTQANRQETVTIDNRLPLRGTLPVFAKSATQNEIWVSLLERAYGIWKQLPGYDVGEPDLSRETEGNALTALQYIAKGVDQYYNPQSVTTAECGYDWQTMLGRISAWFDPANADCSRITASKTRVPMVAWTYNGQGEAPAGVSYTDETIVARHAYSVLGLMYSGGKCYIVLHNPWGRVEATPGTVASGLWTIPTSRYYRRGGQVNPNLPATRFTVDLAVNDGTFALDTGVFMTHFQTIGWLT